MLLQHIYEQYGLSCYYDQTDQGSLLRSGEWYLFPIPVSSFRERSIEVLAYVSSYMREQGENNVAQILATRNGEYVSVYQGDSLVFLAAPVSLDNSTLTGETLARFHLFTQMGTTAYRKDRPYLNWSELWQLRADQTLTWVTDSLKSDTQTDFERKVLEVYPYYAGRAENAIQYIIDLTMDTTLNEGATLCHYRIRRSMWGAKEGYIKWPTEWLVDHPGRDLGEYLRAICWEGENTDDEIRHFFSAYERIRPISQVGASLAYARLLFPLQFFETVEGYYTGNWNAEEAFQALEKCERVSKIEEGLLTRFEKVGLSPIYKVDWLRTDRVQ
jgi:spore coat protein YutH